MYNPAYSFTGMSTDNIDSRFENMKEVSKTPKYRVTIPYRDNVPYPHYCALCCKPYASEERTYLGFFNRRNLGVSIKKKKMEFKGSKLCPECKHRTDMSRGELALLMVSVLLALVIGVVMTVINFEAVCLNFIIGGSAAFLLFFLGRFLIKGRAEKPAMKVEIGTDKAIGNNIRPTYLKFFFRNRRYAYEFAKANNVLLPKDCPKCGNPLTEGPSEYNFCVTCDDFVRPEDAAAA